MRKINEIILHCTDTPQGREVSVKDLNAWHMQRRFKRASNGNYCGYHYIIHLDGSYENARPLSDIGQHCKGHNANSIGICYVGGYKGINTITNKQIETLVILIVNICVAFDLDYSDVKLHNEINNCKLCPSFTRSYFDLVFRDRIIADIQSKKFELFPDDLL